MLKYEIKNNIGIITLDRPEKRNSLHPDLMIVFIEQLKNFENNENIKAIIITGSGTSFCAGADLSYLNSLQNNSTLVNEDDSKLIAKFFSSIYKSNLPIIAAVNGPAIAGGSGLVACCDFVIADEQKSKFGFSEVKIGFLPAIVSYFLVKRIGEAKARQLLISGENIDAQIAFNYGLVDQLTEDVLKSSFELAEKLSQNSLFSIKQTKKMIRNSSSLNVDDAINYLMELNVISRTSKDFQIGLNKFLKK